MTYDNNLGYLKHLYEYNKLRRQLLQTPYAKWGF